MEVTQQKCTVNAYKQDNIVGLPHASFATLIGYFTPFIPSFLTLCLFCVYVCLHVGVEYKYEYIMV